MMMMMTNSIIVKTNTSTLSHMMFLRSCTSLHRVNIDHRKNIVINQFWGGGVHHRPLSGLWWIRVSLGLVWFGAVGDAYRLHRSLLIWLRKQLLFITADKQSPHEADHIWNIFISSTDEQKSDLLTTKQKQTDHLLKYQITIIPTIIIFFILLAFIWPYW